MNDKIIEQKPYLIKAGVLFLYASILSIIIDIIVGGIRYYNMASTHPHINGSNGVIVILIIFLLIYLGILILFTHKISKGKNWARIAFAIIFITIILTNIPSRFQDINILGNSLQLIGFILLFCKPSNQWFQIKKAASKETAL
jgi:hypothetical protein